MANTCKGTRCKKNKAIGSAHFCKVHTTNEICETCGSDFISSTESILASSGKSSCVDCIRQDGKRMLADMQVILEKQQAQNEAKRREMEEKMRDAVQKLKDVMQPCYKAPMQRIVEEIF